jgi:hypothetical protein
MRGVVVGQNMGLLTAAEGHFYTRFAQIVYAHFTSDFYILIIK